MPKLIVTIIYHLMDEKKHASIRSLRLFIQIHSIFLFCLREFPDLITELERNINKFVSDEGSRNKENQPNLGCILAFVTGIDSIRFADVAEAYFHEQLDRQILWILKAVPELIDELVKKDVDQNKIKVVFKSQMTSFQMFCFYKLFITEICEKRKSRKLLLD